VQGLPLALGKYTSVYLSLISSVLCRGLCSAINDGNHRIVSVQIILASLGLEIRGKNSPTPPRWLMHDAPAPKLLWPIVALGHAPNHGRQLTPFHLLALSFTLPLLSFSLPSISERQSVAMIPVRIHVHDD
jgi:hypothetical protein